MNFEYMKELERENEELRKKMEAYEKIIRLQIGTINKLTDTYILKCSEEHS